MENLPKKVRSKKLSTRIDLTAMVSVSFLLIIFFMVTIELAKPRGMDLGLPDRERGCGGEGGCIKANRLYTILLDENNKIITYSGILEFDLNTAKKIQFGKDGIRKEVYQKKKEVSDYMISVGKPKSGVIVIIKPSKKSNFKNLVDILDEMKIANIDAFGIVDEFTPEETKLLASK